MEKRGRKPIHDKWAIAGYDEWRIKNKKKLGKKSFSYFLLKMKNAPMKRQSIKEGFIELYWHTYTLNHFLSKVANMLEKNREDIESLQKWRIS